MTYQQPSLASLVAEYFPQLTESSLSYLHSLHKFPPSQFMAVITLTIASFPLFIASLFVFVITLTVIFITPLIILFSPIWFPAAILFFYVAGFLTICGFGYAATWTLLWMYRYCKGLNPPGSDRVDYARDRVYVTVNHVKDVAKEYGGFLLHCKVKDAAPNSA